MEEAVENGVRKPAKADDDLVAYVRQLEIPLGEAHVTVAAGGALNPEHRVLVRSVFREIRKREATLATHKKCSFVVELLLKIASGAQIVAFFASIEPYLDFMSTNRYSSHVLETLLGLSHALLSGERELVAASDADGDAVEDDAAPPSPDALRGQLVAGVAAMAVALQAHAVELAYDTAGTHILRAMVSVLGGHSPTVHKSVATNVARAEANERAAVAATPTAGPAPPGTGSGWYYPLLTHEESKALRRALVVFVHTLGDCDAPPEAAEGADDDGAAPAFATPVLTLPVGARESSLYALCVDSNASPLLQHCVQVCSGMGRDAPAPRTAAYLCRRLINWGLQGLPAADASGEADVAGTSAAPRAPAVTSGKKRKRAAESTVTPLAPDSTDSGNASACWLLDLAHDAVGSRALESVLLHCDAPLFAALFCGPLSPAALPELALHPVANFVVQRLLASCRTEPQAESAVLALLPHLPRLVAARREGVVWHMVATCAGGAALKQPQAAAPLELADAGRGPAVGGSVGAAARLPVVPFFTGHTQPLSEDTQRLLVAALAQCAVATSSVTAAAVAARASAARAGGGGGAEIAPPAALAASAATGGMLDLESLSAYKHRPNDPHFVRYWLDTNGYRSGGVAAISALDTSSAGAGGSRMQQPRGGGDAASSSASKNSRGAPISFVPFSPTGSRVIAALLKLQPPLLPSATDAAPSSATTASVRALQPLYEGLAHLTGAEVAALSADPFCSRHIVEAVFDARDEETAWLRHKLCGLLRGRFAALAETRFGGWVVTKAFAAVDVKRKTAIASELAAVERTLGGTGGGRAVLRAVRMDTFVANAAAWEAGWGRSASRARLFDDLVAAPVPSAVPATVAAAADVGASHAAASSRAERKVARKERWLAERAAAAAGEGHDGSERTAAADARSAHEDVAQAAAVVADGPRKLGKPGKGSKKVSVAQALAAVGSMLDP